MKTEIFCVFCTLSGDLAKERDFLRLEEVSLRNSAVSTIYIRGDSGNLWPALRSFNEGGWWEKIISEYPSASLRTVVYVHPSTSLLSTSSGQVGHAGQASAGKWLEIEKWAMGDSNLQPTD